MRRLLIALALLVLPPVPAGAEDLTFCHQGLSAKKAGNHDLAIDHYTRCLNEGDLSRGNQAVFYNNRGNAYRGKGDTDRAIADYDRALRIDPDYALAYYNRSLAYHRKGETDRAIADNDRALRHDPDFALAYNNRGLAYIGKGEYDRAIADFDQTLRLDPDYVRAYYNRGRAHFHRGRFARAVPDLRRAVAADPGNAYRPLWLYLAQARAGQGGRAELKDNARHLNLSEWPGPVVRMFLGELGAQAVAGMGEANRTREDKERRVEAYFFAGQQQLLAGRRGEAAAYFREVVKTGITDFIEYNGAKAELKRLGQ